MATRTQKMSGADATNAAMRGLAGSLLLKSGITQKQLSTDSAQSLPAGVKTGVDEVDAIAVLVSCEGADIRFAFNAVPTQGAASLGHVLYSGQSLLVEGAADIAAFKFISKTAATPGVLQMTPRF